MSSSLTMWKLLFLIASWKKALVVLSLFYLLNFCCMTYYTFDHARYYDLPQISKFDYKLRTYIRSIHHIIYI